MEYEFTLTGTMPLLMHADDVMASDELTEWRRDHRNKSISVPGDDRSPPWTWQTYLYHDGEHLAMPQENIMAALRFAGAKIPAKGKATFKSMSQSGLLIGSDLCVFTNNDERVAVADIHALRDEKFSVQKDRCKALGFDLSVKRARNPGGKTKQVRVRAKFDAWAVSGLIVVAEPAITAEVLEQMFEIAGKLAGLGDWRPSSPDKPGPFGMFTARLKLVKGARRVG
jgi:hypothetical protein